MSSISSPKVAAPYQLAASRYGTMLVNPNDWYMGFAYLKYGECCQFETNLLLELIKAPGQVIEVGANMGIFTVPMALALSNQKRSMVAFEPQPVIFQQLCANLAINGLMNVAAIPYACAAQPGVVAFTVPNYREPGNFGGTEMFVPGTAPQDNSRIQQVACFPLDNFVHPGEVALIKVDVEGFELGVLQGAEQTLRRAKPVLYVENDRTPNSKALIQWLLERDYKLWWHVPALYNPENVNGIEENVYGGIASFNMLCMPAGRECPFPSLDPILEPCIHPILIESARRNGQTLE